MKEKINWQKELIESGKFNDKFSKNLLEHGAKNFMQGIYLGYMYSRWRKIRGLDKNDPIENTGQMQSSFKDIEKKIIHILESKVKPAVANDGGDIKFLNYKDGVVKVKLQGSCSGCPSSTITLKRGVQNLLQHYIPEIKQVEAD